MINLKLNDNQYMNNGIDHIRKVSRAILLNENNQVCLLKISGEDIFGKRDYYETPGGGVDLNESYEEANVLFRVFLAAIQHYDPSRPLHDQYESYSVSRICA